MRTQMMLRIDPELKDKLGRLARTEGKTTSEMVRGLIEDYVKDHDMASYIDGLWGKVGKKLKAKGVTQEDVSRAVKTARKRKQ